MKRKATQVEYDGSLKDGNALYARAGLNRQVYVYQAA